MSKTGDTWENINWSTYKIQPESIFRLKNGVYLSLGFTLDSTNNRVIHPVYYSTDSCKTWQSSNLAPAVSTSASSDPFWDPHFIQFEDKILLVCCNEANYDGEFSILVYYSEDNGKTWQEDNIIPLEAKTYTSNICYVDGVFVYTAIHEGMWGNDMGTWITTDGTNYTRISQGNYSKDIIRLNQSTLLLSLDNGIHKSIDNGNTWASIASSLAGASFSLADNGTVYTYRLWDNPQTHVRYTEVRRSVDAGDTWSIDVAGAGGISGGPRLFIPLSNNEYLIANDAIPNKIYKGDATGTVTEVFTDNKFRVNSGVVTTSTGRVLIGGTYEESNNLYVPALLCTDDNGETFTSKAPSYSGSSSGGYDQASKIVQIENGDILVAGYSGAAKSSDNGDTWSLLLNNVRSDIYSDDYLAIVEDKDNYTILYTRKTKEPEMYLNKEGLEHVASKMKQVAIFETRTALDAALANHELTDYTIVMVRNDNL